MNMARLPIGLIVTLASGLASPAALAQLPPRTLAHSLFAEPAHAPRTLTRSVGHRVADSAGTGTTATATELGARAAPQAVIVHAPRASSAPDHIVETSTRAPVRVRGRAIGWDGAPLAGATVDVPKLNATTSTDANGNFEIHLPPGRYEARIARLDHVPLESVLVASEHDAGAAPAVREYALCSRDLQVDAVTVTAPRIDAPHQEAPGRYRLHSKDVQREIGSFEDIMRSVQALPGVARASDYHGEYFVRGAGSNANTVYLDGVPIFFPYHILGFNSIFNPGIVETAEFYAGGAPAAYASGTGGLMLVHSRGETAGLNGGAVGLSYVSGHLRASGGSARRGWVLSLRRSYHDKIARLVDRSSPNQIPSFHDGMARMRWNLGERHLLVAGLLSAGDGMSLDNPEGQALRSDFVEVGDANGSFDTSRDRLVMNNRLRLGSLYWRAQLGEGSALETRFGIAPQRLRFTLQGVNDESLDIDTHLLSLRQDLTMERGAHRFRLGIETYRTRTQGLVSSYAAFLNLRQTNSSLNLSDQPERYLINVASTRLYGAAYGQDEWRLWDGRLEFAPGLRYEYDSLTRELLVSPRAALSVRPHAGWQVRGTWGVYSTLRNTPMEVQPSTTGEPLRAERAVETSLGFTHEWTRTLHVGATAYRKTFLNLVYETEPAYYENGAEARSHGVETWLQLSPVGAAFQARVQYAWSKTQQRDPRAWRRRLNAETAGGEPVWGPVYELPYWYSPIQDQRHRVGLDARMQLRSWELATHLQVASGLPYTPVVDVVHDSEGDAYGIVGRKGSARLPLYHRLDLRVTRHFRGDRLRWRLYAELLNATAANNVYMYRWNRAYTSQYAVNMLPLLPTLGVEASF